MFNKLKWAKAKGIGLSTLLRELTSFYRINQSYDYQHWTYIWFGGTPK